MDKVKEDEEKTLIAAKEEYQTRLRQLKEEANEEIRKLKEDSYDSQGRRFTNMERDNLVEKKRITDSYEAVLTKEQEQKAEREKLYSNKLEGVLASTNEQSNHQIEAQKADFARITQENRAEAERTKKTYEAEVTKERMSSQKNAEHIAELSNSNTEKTIKDKSEKYDQYIRENRKKTDMEMAQRDHEITDLKTTDDPRKVSPRAKDRLEQAYRQRFNQDLAEEKRVNELNMAALKNQTTSSQQSTRDLYAKNFHEMSNDLRMRHQTEKQALVQGYSELDARSQYQQKTMDERFRDHSQKSYQQHAEEMSLHEEKTQERLKDQRYSLLDDKFREKDELETKQRIEDREWRFKLTDTKREYEKKLVDQKELHEKEMSQAKFEFDKKLQEQQRTAKRYYDERVRAYEDQLKQQESMHKAKDRLLAEHYEEELDSIKRTNARITQAKS